MRETMPSSRALEQAFAALRDRSDADGAGRIDDQTLAVFIERGIDALDGPERDSVMAALGSDPALAGFVVSMRESAKELPSRRAVSVLGWKLALAACLVLAGGMTLMLTIGHETHRPVQLLDAASGGGMDEDHRSSPELVAIAVLLWIAAAALAWRAFRSGSAREAT